ncbi:hypothetical protein [Nocardia abscessus]|uniref:hypothetical protein n=1 Tax=Nocardia abscessus TaxID=120957 RepID=UPI002456BAD0|nr:hypothetical protein [Nocardia abscessus]
MLTRIFAVPALALAALTAVAGTAYADLGHDQPISFTAHATDTSSIIEIDSGALVVEDRTLKARSRDGVTVAGTPLTFTVDEFEFPIIAEVSGHTATLTPDLSMDRAVYKPVALPFEDKAPWKTEYDREQAAWSRMTSTISMGATIGTLVGGMGGAAVGCVLGGIAGATIAAGTIAGLFGPFIPAAAVGCLVGVAAVGALGTVAGQILVTAPVAVGAAIQYFTTINAPYPAK